MATLKCQIAGTGLRTSLERDYLCHGTGYFWYHASAAALLANACCIMASGGRRRITSGIAVLLDLQHISLANRFESPTMPQEPIRLTVGSQSDWFSSFVNRANGLEAQYPEKSVLTWVPYVHSGY
jgi:hypothetical protein